MVKRIFHPWTKWECYKNGFYNKHPLNNISDEKANFLFINFFKDIKLFDKTITKVFKEWKYSCEHFLTNSSINKVAWLGQACVCFYHGVPCIFKKNFYKLPLEKQTQANLLAQKRINEWRVKNEK